MHELDNLANTNAIAQFNLDTKVDAEEQAGVPRHEVAQRERINNPTLSWLKTFAPKKAHNQAQHACKPLG